MLNFFIPKKMKLNDLPLSLAIKEDRFLSLESENIDGRGVLLNSSYFQHE